LVLRIEAILGFRRFVARSYVGFGIGLGGGFFGLEAFELVESVAVLAVGGIDAALEAGEFVAVFGKGAGEGVVDVDGVFDTVGKSGLSRSLRCLKRGGFYVRVEASGNAGDDRAGCGGRVGVDDRRGESDWRSGGGHAGRSDISERADRGGKLRTVIDRCYPLANIVEAHRLAEGGHKKGHVAMVVE
jgi:NADPH:quinone reductase-like Zn-dependent oxidoreductase